MLSAFSLYKVPIECDTRINSLVLIFPFIMLNLVLEIVWYLYNSFRLSLSLAPNRFEFKILYMKHFTLWTFESLHT